MNFLHHNKSIKSPHPGLLIIGICLISLTSAQPAKAECGKFKTAATCTAHVDEANSNICNWCDNKARGGIKNKRCWSRKAIQESNKVCTTDAGWVSWQTEVRNQPVQGYAQGRSKCHWVLNAGRVIFSSAQKTAAQYATIQCGNKRSPATIGRACSQYETEIAEAISKTTVSPLLNPDEILLDQVSVIEQKDTTNDEVLLRYVDIPLANPRDKTQKASVQYVSWVTSEGAAASRLKPFLGLPPPGEGVIRAAATTPLIARPHRNRPWSAEIRNSFETASPPPTPPEGISPPPTSDISDLPLDARSKDLASGEYMTLALNVWKGPTFERDQPKKLKQKVGSWRKRTIVAQFAPEFSYVNSLDARLPPRGRPTAAEANPKSVVLEEELRIWWYQQDKKNRRVLKGAGIVNKANPPQGHQDGTTECVIKGKSTKDYFTLCFTISKQTIDLKRTQVQENGLIDTIDWQNSTDNQYVFRAAFSKTDPSQVALYNRINQYLHPTERPAMARHSKSSASNNEHRKYYTALENFNTRLESFRQAPPSTKWKNPRDGCHYEKLWGIFVLKATQSR